MAEREKFYTIKVIGDSETLKKVGAIEKEIKALTAETESLTKAQGDNTAAIGKNLAQLKLLRKEKSDLLKETTQQTQANKLEEGSLLALRAQLSKDTAAYDALGKAKRESAQGKELEASIAAQVSALNKLEQATGRYGRQVGNYNTAGVAMSQVLREIPAFTFSAQTGILALSNNIPILVDEMKRLSTSIDVATGKSKGWKGAFLEMGKNLLSFGSIMTIGLGLFTIFSDKIFAAIAGEEKLSDKQKQLNDDLKEGEQIQYRVNNAWKVYNGELTTAEAALDNVAHVNQLALEQIEKDTKDKLENVNGFWNTLWTNAIGGVSGVGGGIIRAEQAAKIIAEDSQAKSALLNNQKKADEDLLKQVRATDREIELIKAQQIPDEYTRQRRLMFLKTTFAIEDIEATEASQQAKQAAIKSLTEKYYADLGLLDKQFADKKAEEEKKRAQDNAKLYEDNFNTLLSLTEQYYKVLAENTTDKNDQAFLKEKLYHEQRLRELQSFYGKSEVITAAANRLIEQENERHYRELVKITLTEIDDQKRDENKLYTDEQARFANANEVLAKMQSEYLDKRNKKRKEKDKELGDAIKDGLNYFSEIENAYWKLREQRIENSLKQTEKAITNNAETENQILKNRLDKGIDTEIQYAEKKAALDKKTADENYKAQKEAFEKKKKLAKNQIIIDWNVATAATWANVIGNGGSWQSALAKSLVIAAESGLLLAAVDAQEFATGGKVMDRNRNIPTKRNGDNVLTTLTVGEVVLNKQQQAALGGDSTFAAIGVPGFNAPNPSLSGGSQAIGINKKDLLAMGAVIVKGINNKKVINLESESKLTRDRVANYESERVW